MLAEVDFGGSTGTVLQKSSQRLACRRRVRTCLNQVNSWLLEFHGRGFDGRSSFVCGLGVVCNYLLPRCLPPVTGSRPLWRHRAHQSGGVRARRLLLH